MRATRRLTTLAAAVLLTALAGCKVEMHSNLDERAGNEMLAALLSNGISAEKVKGKEGVSLHVAEAQFSEAVQLLNSLGLPRDTFASVEQIFDAEGIVASPTQEWAKLTYAKSQEISGSISSIPGIVKVSVNIAESRKDGPFGEKKPPSASVVVQVAEEQNSADLVPQIKQLVSYSIPDIKYDRVGVIVAPVSARKVKQEMVSVSGILVHKDSVLAVRVVAAIAALSSVIALSCGAFLLLNWRSGRARRRSAGTGANVVEAVV